MPIERMDHVGIVVDDLDAGIGFFAALGLVLDGRTEVGGEWVDRVIGLRNARSEIAMLRTPDGHGCIELVQFDTLGTATDAAPPSDAMGLRHVTFAVTDLDATLAAIMPHGGALVGEVVDYEDIYRLCYVRGPADVIIEMAERLG